MQSLTLWDMFDHLGESVVDPTDGATGVIRLYHTTKTDGVEVAWDGRGKYDPEMRDRIATTGWDALAMLSGTEADPLSQSTGLYLVEPLLKRAARACVRDHAPRDLLTAKVEQLEPAEVARIREDILSESEYRRMVIEDHLDMRRVREEYDFHAPTRPIDLIVDEAEVLGNAAAMSKHGRPTGIVVRLTYAQGKKWLADYEVNVDPNLPAICWQD